MTRSFFVQSIIFQKILYCSRVNSALPTRCGGLRKELNSHVLRFPITRVFCGKWPWPYWCAQEWVNDAHSTLQSAEVCY